MTRTAVKFQMDLNNQERLRTLPLYWQLVCLMADLVCFTSTFVGSLVVLFLAMLSFRGSSYYLFCILFCFSAPHCVMYLVNACHSTTVWVLYSIYWGHPHFTLHRA